MEQILARENYRQILIISQKALDNFPFIWYNISISKKGKYRGYYQKS